jgi:hypothetical protein
LDPMAWMDCSRALLKDFIQLCKSAKKKFLVHSSILFYFLTSSHLDCPKIDPIALPFPVRYCILLSSLLSPAKALLSCHCCLPHPAADFILKPLLSKLSHHLSLHRCAAGSAFLLALTLPSLSRCFCHCAAAAFVIVLPLPSSSRRCSLHCCTAGSAFVFAPSLSSLSRHRFCLRHRAAAAFIVAPLVLPLSSCRWFCLRHRATAAFVIVPPPVLHMS